MTHTGPIPDSAGTFSPAEQTTVPCRKCNQQTVVAQKWESNDGAYEDYRYTCTDKKCGYIWWVDGIDS